jgi:hypothetical protein
MHKFICSILLVITLVLTLPPGRLCGTQPRLCGRKCSLRLPGLGRILWGMASLPPLVGTPVLLAGSCRGGTWLSLWLLCGPTGGRPTGAPGVCPTAAAGKLLVLLPESSRLLSIHQKLPGRLDEGRAGDGSPQSVKEDIGYGYETNMPVRGGGVAAQRVCDDAARSEYHGIAGPGKIF